MRVESGRVEQATLRRQIMQKVAAEESAPFLQDLVAAFGPRSLAPQIVREAHRGEAREEGVGRPDHLATGLV